MRSAKHTAPAMYAAPPHAMSTVGAGPTAGAVQSCGISVTGASPNTTYTVVNTQFGVRSQTICSIVPIAVVVQITVRYGRRIAGLSANSTGVLVPAMMRKMFE